MDELPDIDTWLVTPEHPARAIDGIDYERCAALHNHLVQYAWVAGNRSLGDFERKSWFEKHGDRANEMRERLAPTLVTFLESAYDFPSEVYISMFYWVQGLNEPDALWENWEMFAEEDEASRRMTLYKANSALASHADGVCYDQKIHKCRVYPSIDDHAAEEDEATHLYRPLETVLSNWIAMIRLGKITAGTDGVTLNNERFPPWLYHSYSPQQVFNTVAAFNRLVVAIESRLPAAQGQSPDWSPILSNEILDSALVPNPSFARSFLSTIRPPQFKYIAPGLSVPSPDNFVQSQSFTSTKDDCDIFAIPPVLLFCAEETIQKCTPEQYSGACFTFGPLYKTIMCSENILAGVYSPELSRSDQDTAEEGFRLILPFSLENNVAKKSNGDSIEGSFAELYQHGSKIFGGDNHRPQRLERLLDQWTRMVERGMWEVGVDGVMGGIEKFKEADTEIGWRNYWIEPDW